MLFFCQILVDKAVSHIDYQSLKKSKTIGCVWWGRQHINSMSVSLTICSLSFNCTNLTTIKRWPIGRVKNVRKRVVKKKF